jgi:hypothetical protein
MIHINLLPPELRKRRSGVSPVFASLAAGIVVCLLLIAGLVVVHLHIKAAETKIADLTGELEAKKREAAVVIAMEAAIVDAKKQNGYLVTLLAKKMYWAQALDDFVNALNSQWSLPGFDVRCLGLTISPSGSASASGGKRASTDTEVSYDFKWRYKLVGKATGMDGDYIKSFFNTLAGSRLWRDYGFAGQPQASYRGHNPKLNAAIDSVIIENSLDWRRVKVIPTAKPAPAAATGSN